MVKIEKANFIEGTIITVAMIMVRFTFIVRIILNIINFNLTKVLTATAKIKFEFLINHLLTFTIIFQKCFIKIALIYATLQ